MPDASLKCQQALALVDVVMTKVERFPALRAGSFSNSLEEYGAQPAASSSLTPLLDSSSSSLAPSLFSPLVQARRC